VSDRPTTLIAGAGIVGIACGIALQKHGFNVTIVDPEPPGSQTSMGNAGGLGCTEVMPIGGPGVLWRLPGWLLDPLGPLSLRWNHLPAMLPWLRRFHRASSAKEVLRISAVLSELLGRSIKDTHAMVSDAKLQHLLTAEGAITVYESIQSRAKDDLEWEIKKQHGITVEPVNAAQIQQMEPALSNVHCGYFTPEWENTTDPFELCRKLADYFCQTGGRILRQKITGFEVTPTVRPIFESGIGSGWDKIVIAAGVWSAKLCRQLGESVCMESERGYNTTLPASDFCLNRQIIFGDRKFVATQLDDGIRIGGAAEFAGITAPANFKRSERLVQIAKYYLPALNVEGGTPWMGHRPSTPDSLPVIGASIKHNNVFYAFGHGHLGLTTAATTATLIGQLIAGEKPGIKLDPFSIERFC
jgi:D-amino-acid dehydrogenase